MNRFDPATGRFTRFTTRTGFPTDHVTNILEDNDGRLWIGTKDGFVRFDSTTGATRVLTVDDGLAGNQFQEAALWKSADGTIWVATITGASSFNPRELVDNPNIPPVVITSITQSGEPMPLGTAPERAQAITLDWRRNFFEAEFAALSFSRSQKNRYKYRLEGLDSDWVDSGTRRFCRYAGLADGRYTLRIIGSNNDGVWNVQGATLQVTVEAPFWRTWWFRLLTGLTMAGLVVTVVRARHLRHVRARQALERDLAERARTEAILRESETRFRSLVSNVPGTFYRAGFDGRRRMRFLSSAFSGLTGEPAERYTATDAPSFDDLISPDDAPHVERAIADAVRERTPFSVEYRLVRTDGSARWVQDRGRAEYGPDGALASLDGALVDITERRTLEAKVLQAEKLESIGRLAGGIAHDLNSLLTVILGHAELASMDLPAESPLVEGLEQIQEAGRRASRLTSQLLIFARRSMVMPQVIDINRLVLDLDKMLRRLIGTHIELVTLPGDDLWPVKADPNQIEQVILNLTLNARDAMPDGGRLVIRTSNVTMPSPDAAAETTPSSPSGECVLIEVSDSGEGMSEEIRQHVFEPFFTTKQQGKGTGLGLASCYGIVEQAGGQITVDSTPGTGSTFRVVLPRATDTTSLPAHDHDRAAPRGGSETILVVEDEPLVREFVVQVLEQYGYRVLPATDGESALRLVDLADGPIDLVLTDIIMPRMGGRELAEELTRRSLPAAILYMSGYDRAVGTRGQIVEDGTEWLPKPFSATELARKVRTVLDAHASRRTPCTDGT